VIVAYHPEANGIVERRNTEILKHLRILVQNKDILDEWSLVLPLVQRILNFIKDGSINMAPAQILFGDMIPCGLSLIMTSNEESGTIQIAVFLEKLKQKQLLLIQATQKYLSENASKREERGNLIIDVPVFDVEDYVLLTYPSRPPSKLAGLYRGPMVVNRRLRQDLYEVRDLITDRLSDVHISRMLALNVPDDASREDILRLAGLDHGEYVVDSIVDHRRVGSRKYDLEFLVRWQGYEPSEDTWETYTNVKDLAALDTYLKAHSDLGIV